jgi:hypothetical protein
MPYEDDYKMWLEKMLIEMNPDWVCDGMADKEFTHDWCEKYCGKDNAYITPKCLHMYYHHIARADRKTEPTGYNLLPVDKDINVRSKDEPQWDVDKGTTRCDNCSENGSYKCTKCDGEMYFKRLEVEDEPQNGYQTFNGTSVYVSRLEDEPQTEETEMDEYYKDHDEFYDCAWK